jgi:DNA-binding TFAR19-related protein (PDSD5 family)
MSTSPTVPDLQKQYKEKYAAYDSLIQNALATNDASALPRIRALNKELNEILEKMLADLNTAPGPLRIQREELVTTLNRIQRDYTGLKDESDTLILLRRIREGETSGSHKEFQFYLGSFFVLCLGILAMLFFGGQMKLATVTSPMTPASTAPLV